MASHMSSGPNDFISTLQKSRLYAQCTSCRHEFKLSDALLFDGRASFPAPAQERRQEMESELDNGFADLVRRKEKALAASETAAASIGVGKIVEKVFFTHKDFSIDPSDCRFLAEPVDVIAFNGVAQNRVDSITFMEVKTGGARLNAHQKQIRDAVEDKKVKWKVL